MDCREARQLLDQGVEPGGKNPTRAQLGFHLAGCAACRSYRRSLHQLLLSDLLLEQETDPLPAPVPVQWAPLPAAQVRHRLRQATMGIFALAGILLLLLAGRVTIAAFTFRQNIQSFVVPTPTRSVTAPIPTLPAQPGIVAFSETPVPQLAVAPPEGPQNPLPATSSAGQPSPVIIVPTVPQSEAIVIVPTVPQNGTVAIIPTLASITATPVVPLAGAPVNILLLGSDRRPGEQGPSRTDTVIVARVDPERKRVALLSLPRDLIVEIPGYGYSRINSAHVYGDLYPELGGGLELARKTVSNLLGVPIDYAVLIDFEGFIGLIDAIGGIDIDVPVALYDGAYPTMDYNYMEVYFEAGPQHMDGSRALQYSRIRHMDSDFERARRQQMVLMAAGRRLREQNPLQLLDSFVSASSSLRGYVWTDLPEDRMIGLAWALRDLPVDSVERYLLDENMITFNGGNDPWAEHANPGAIDNLVQQWLGQAQ